MNKLFFILTIVLLGCKNNANQKTNSSENTPKENLIEGSWELVSIKDSIYSFDSLYNLRKPTITFDTSAKRFSGNSSCNSYNGQLKTSGNKIDFTIPIVMTKMFCEGEGENIFMKNLHTINYYQIENNTLTFKMDERVIMKFVRIEKN